MISFLTAMSLDGISCILCKCYVFFKNIDVPLVLFVLFFMFKQWVGLCPPDVQNYIPLCCGLICGQNADVWHGNGFYESFIMPIASKDWVSIQC